MPLRELRIVSACVFVWLFEWLRLHRGWNLSPVAKTVLSGRSVPDTGRISITGGEWAALNQEQIRNHVRTPYRN